MLHIAAKVKYTEIAGTSGGLQSSLQLKARIALKLVYIALGFGHLSFKSLRGWCFHALSVHSDVVPYHSCGEELSTDVELEFAVLLSGISTVVIQRLLE